MILRHEKILDLQTRLHDKSVYINNHLGIKFVLSKRSYIILLFSYQPNQTDPDHKIFVLHNIGLVWYLYPQKVQVRFPIKLSSKEITEIFSYCHLLKSSRAFARLVYSGLVELLIQYWDCRILRPTTSPWPSL